ncbi:MAG: metallophosphoesterase [Phycisphaerae bacterium]
MTPDVTLLVLTDIHDAPEPFEETPHRRCELGRELVRRAVEDARRSGGFDAVVLLGDLLNDGRAPSADACVHAIMRTVRESARGIPLLIVPGNHDYRADADTLPGGLDASSRVVEVGGCRFVIFADRYPDTMHTRRSEADLQLLARTAEEPGGPIVALQHNPVHVTPPGDYPYMHANRDEVVDAYRRAGVLLSLSGHYHRGQSRSETDGVTFFTAPSLCESPYRYSLVTLRGRSVDIRTRALATGEALRPVDSHAHTELAYCGGGISADTLVARSRLMGLGGVVVTEHAPQLYCSPDDFWDARHVFTPLVWRDGVGRMQQFRRLIEPLAGPFVRTGLEVELDVEGELTLRDADRDVADVLIGAVHWVPSPGADGDPRHHLEAFLEANLAIVRGGVDILAHPFRKFRVRGAWAPDSVYDELSSACAEHGVAAEVNFHNAAPDERFFAACIEKGVKLAFATDAHQPWEAGGLSTHVTFVQRLAGRADISDLLLYPDGFSEPAVV